MVKVKRIPGNRKQFLANNKIVEDGQIFDVHEKVYAANKDALQVVEEDGEAAKDQTPDYTKMKFEEVKAEADKRGLEVEGSGKDGNVIKSDYEKALKADDEAKAEE
jgi:hypothetical protein